LFVSAAGTFLFHWRVFPPPPPGAGTEAFSYLPGLYARIVADPIYQLYLASPIGVLGYGMCMLAAFKARIRLRQSGGDMTKLGQLVHWLSGLPTARSNDNSRWRAAVDYGIQYANAPVRDAAVIYPGLGFLGTVVGISIAIGGLPKAAANQDLAELTYGLRVAFDTTFFGLVAALLLSLIVLAAQALQAEADALDDVGMPTEATDIAPVEPTHAAVRSYPDSRS
jgi:hypothetical protein